MSQLKTGGIYIMIVCFSPLAEVKHWWYISVVKISWRRKQTTWTSTAEMLWAFWCYIIHESSEEAFRLVWDAIPTIFPVKSASHTDTTHGPRTGKVSILASASSFAGCASPCATRASSALDQGYAFVVVRCVRRDFCACTKMCAELDAWMYTPEGRQRCAERAGPTPDTRGAHAEHTLGMRCVFVDWVLTHTKRIMSAHPACF